MSKAAETAYYEIRQRILSGEFSPNTQLTERELATICNVSRTPVKDALRRLEAEMLVRRTDTQRCFIPNWTTEQAEEVYSLRGLLESYAARLAASRITPEQIAELKECNRQIKLAIDADGDFDLERVHGANRNFHRIILEAAQSERLMMMHNFLFQTSPRVPPKQEYDREHFRRSHTEHEELVWRLETHDPIAAYAVMEHHIRHAFFRSFVLEQAEALDPRGSEAR